MRRTDVIHEKLEVPSAYRKKPGPSLYFFFVIVILIGYAFFFSASAFIPLSMDEEESPFDQEIAFGEEGKRTVTLYDWKYCEESKLMEVKLRFFNGEFDGTDDYVYDVTLQRGSKENIKVREVLNEQLLTVLQIGPIGKGFRHITLYFAPKYERAITRKDMGSISILEADMDKVDRIEKRSREEYLIDRLDLIIRRYEERNAAIEQEIAQNDTTIQNIKRANEKIDEDKTFQTADEIDLSNEEKRENEARISELEGSNSQLEVEKKQNDLEISSAQETKKSISEEASRNRKGTKEMAFEDVKETDWFYKDVEYVTRRKIMSGTSETQFSPKQETTRAQIITMLWRIDGEPDENSGAGYYTDVKEGSYYEEAAGWAANNRIVTGSGEQKFDPDKPITREELAVILMRYAKFRGKDITKESDLSIYTDKDEISPWAEEALSWAKAYGYISGISESMIGPKGTAIRAEVAVILHRYLS